MDPNQASDGLAGQSLDAIIKLTEADRRKLSQPAGVSVFQRQKLNRDAKKSWDLFYKRNGDRFFKKRHWTRREFHELLGTNARATHVDTNTQRYLLEVGCGCGDFALPFLEVQRAQDDHDLGNRPRADVSLPEDLFIYCCDISDEAIRILTSNPVYKRHHPSRIKAFVADITTERSETIANSLDGQLMDYVSLIFVLSALDPDQMRQAVSNLSCLLKPGGLVLFRDYAIYDEAMMRFSESSKIDDQFYVRQDGTRAYFFSKEQLGDLFGRFDFHCETICYVERETINNATKNKYSRIFLQAKLRRKGEVST